MSCKVQRLHIINCGGLVVVIEELRKQTDLNPEMLELITMSLRELVLDGTIVSDASLFDWFISNITFNRKRQEVHSISFQRCALTSQHMESINRVLAELQVYQKREKLRNYFSLRSFNFSYNPGIDE